MKKTELMRWDCYRDLFRCAFGILVFVMPKDVSFHFAVIEAMANTELPYLNSEHMHNIIMS